MAKPADQPDKADYSDFDARYLRQDRRFGVERVNLTAVPEIDVSPFLFDGEGAGCA